MVRRFPTAACQCWRVLAMPRNLRSSRLATSTSSSTSSSLASASSSCSWQEPGQPPSHHSRSPWVVEMARPGRCGCGASRRRGPSGWPGAGALHPGRQPVQANRLAGCGHLGKPPAQVVEGGDEGAVGLAGPQCAKLTKHQVQAVADLGLGDPDHPGGARTTARPAAPR